MQPTTYRITAGTADKPAWIVPAAILPVIRERWQTARAQDARAAFRLACALAPTIPASGIMALLGEGGDWIARAEGDDIIIAQR